MYSANVGEYRNERTDIKVYTKDKLGSPHYSSRLYKILSHIYDPVEWSVYVDADIFLPEGMAEKLIEEVKNSGKLVGVFRNPFRDCVYEEAEEVVRLGKDTEENVRPLIDDLKKENYPEHGGLAACGVLVRHHTKETIERNLHWWVELCCFSRRDQITFPVVWGDTIHYFEGNIYDFKKKK